MSLTRISIITLSLLIAMNFSSTTGRAEGIRGDGTKCLVYIGTYTDHGSKGIYAARMDLASGALTPIGLAAETPNPTFLAMDAAHQRLFAANEIDHFEGKPAGAISGFSIDAASGKLTLLNQRSSGGGGPCHLLLDKEAKNCLVANYGGGSVAVLPVQADGRLEEAATFIQHEGSGPNRSRQEKAHAHCMGMDAANRFAFVCDLGLDKVMIYKFDGEHGKLTANEPAFFKAKPGAGPRHIAFHPNGRFAYVINELAGTMTALAYDGASGALTELETVSILPEDFKEHNLSAEVAVHPSGKFVYGSNRGHDSIAVFKIDEQSGKLTFVQRQSTQGKTPRNFGIEPTGKFLVCADQDSNKVLVFAINQQTGELQATGSTLEISQPVCVVFLPEK